MARAAAPGNDGDAGQRHRDRMAKRSRDSFDSVAEIGSVPPVADPDRRERCRLNLHEFLKTYFPATTGKSPFSDDHLRVISRLQEAATQGGRYFNLVYRGFAKTTISVNTCLWALLYGHRHLVVLVGANRDAAKDLLDQLKAELETNDLLLEDFPEVCLAVRALEGKNQRCNSQTCGGELTRIEWTKDRVVFPTIESSLASGAAVVTRGITSSIRGIGHRRADGTQQRPDLVICDDLQTDASARSFDQVRTRLKTLSKTILKLAGHDSTIACVVNGTIIEPDDLMDRLRDALQFPGWQGETVAMVKSWSDSHETHWMGEYARLRKSFDPEMPGDQDRAKHEANQYYLAHRAEMDTGCNVSWEHCYDHELEYSAIQHAYNSLIDDGEETFASECQQAPLKSDADQDKLTIKDVIHKLSGLKHREVPANAARVTCFIDTQDESFWYTVIAWTSAYTGYVIDYGAWPDQHSRDASKKKLRQSLAQKYKSLKTREARWRQGLSDLCDELLARDWLDDEGHAHAITFAFVDVADGDASLELRAWVKASKWSKVLKPSMGAAMKPGATPMGEQKKSMDEIKRGLNWIEKRDKKIRGGTITTIDTNWWKSFSINRWQSSSPRVQNDSSQRPNEPGGLYLWGTDPHAHSTFGAHQVSETAKRLEDTKTGRKIDFWSLKPNKPDNEWFDGVVGCCVLANMAGGIELKDSGLNLAQSKGRKKLSAAELRAIREAKQNG
jgi:Phage terminase large subunit (GpA)